MGLTSQVVISSAGCRTDVHQLWSTLKIRMRVYEHDHEREMSATAVAQLLSTTLYGRRFFPYYSFNVLAGVDSEGKGGVWNYDAIGSGERVPFSASGSGEKLIVPIMDNLVSWKNRTDEHHQMTSEEVVALMKDAFITA